MRRKKQKVENPADLLKERYSYIEELIIKTSGHLLLLKKIRGKASEPINIDLFDFKDEIDEDIGWIIRKIDWKLKLWDKPDGIKE